VLFSSLALISGRATLNALEVLNMVRHASFCSWIFSKSRCLQLIASYFYILCQALDLRALQKHYNTALSNLLTEELTTHLSQHLPGSSVHSLHSQILPAIIASLDATTTMDAIPRLETAASASTAPIVDFITSSTISSQVRGDIFGSIAAFRASFSRRGARTLQDLRHSFVSGTPPPPFGGSSGYNPLAPAAPFLGRTRPVYEYIRVELGVRTHGLENWKRFEEGLGSIESQPGVGRNVSIIYEVCDAFSILSGIT
jgi:phenylalanine ammonia-lyase